MLFLQHGPLRVRKNFLQHRLCRFRSKRLPLRAQKIGCDSEHRRLPDSEMEVRRRLIARRHQKFVQSRIFLRAAGSKRLRSDGVNFRPRRITRRAELIEKVDRPRTHISISVFLGDLHQRVLHLRMFEIAQRLKNLDAHVGSRISEQLPEGRKRARIADAAEGLHSSPFHICVCQ